mmetsp:Transcript_28708/g.65582  ORF Transcript_28708/g.65582 Transcript_28708/m.65582 type:complete len:253 (+) Transcript_28708:716-1474(+)
MSVPGWMVPRYHFGLAHGITLRPSGSSPENSIDRTWYAAGAGGAARRGVRGSSWDSSSRWSICPSKLQSSRRLDVSSSFGPPSGVTAAPGPEGAGDPARGSLGRHTSKRRGRAPEPARAAKSEKGRGRGGPGTPKAGRQTASPERMPARAAGPSGTTWMTRVRSSPWLATRMPMGPSSQMVTGRTAASEEENSGRATSLAAMSCFLVSRGSFFIFFSLVWVSWPLPALLFFLFLFLLLSGSSLGSNSVRSFL